MCGFAGVLTRHASPPGELRAQVERMTARIAHRGPDDHGSWVEAENGVALGFRRLAIIDLSAHGHQPMRSASGRLTLVFNGEVYNHRELRRELEAAGARFRGHSDTEVVLEAIERWGIHAAARRFVGMFALAVWDARDRSLSLLRDRLGIKPLYVHSGDGVVLFGSELKALLAHPAFEPSLDRSALAGYFRHLYVPAPRTIFERTQKLPPGSVLVLRDPALPLPRSERFWSLEEVAREGSRNPIGGGDREWVDGLERRLREAVALRMRSDVPFGALLSGGVDSSAVVALMQEASPRPVKTFCIGFDDPRFDESSHAAAIARHLGTDHTEIRLSGDEALESVPRVVEIFDEPFADPSQLPSLLICELARRDVTVALAGDGGDELFAGYNRYTHGGAMIARALRLPRPLRRAASGPLHALPASGWEGLYRTVRPLLPGRLHERLVGEKVEKLGNLLARDTAAGMYRSLVSAWQDPAGLLLEGAEGPDAIERAFRAAEPPGLVERMLLADQMGYLPDDLLAKVDRVSMAVSLEVRVPLLDHRVVEFAWKLPARARIRDGRGKWILREVLHRRVPREMVERPKMGFSVPLSAWLRGPLRPWAEGLLDPERLRRAEILDPARVWRAWTSLQRGRDHLALALWSVLMFEAWRERWMVSPSELPGRRPLDPAPPPVAAGSP